VRLGIVSGRLRQGETYLLDAAANTFDGFFLAAADSTETDSLASFGRVLASYSGAGRYAFADWDGTERPFGVVGEGLRRGQIQADVAVFASDEPGHLRRVLSLGEAKWERS
jgi:hypothetical protein